MVVLQNLMNEKINLNLNGSFNLAGQRKKKSQPAFSLGLSFSYALTTKIKFGSIRYNFKNDDLRTGYCTKLF